MKYGSQTDNKFVTRTNYLCTDYSFNCGFLNSFSPLTHAHGLLNVMIMGIWQSNLVPQTKITNLILIRFHIYIAVQRHSSCLLEIQLVTYFMWKTYSIYPYALNHTSERQCSIDNVSNTLNALHNWTLTINFHCLQKLILKLSSQNIVHCVH